MTEAHVDTADLDSIRSVSDDWHATSGARDRVALRYHTTPEVVVVGSLLRLRELFADGLARLDEVMSARLQVIASSDDGREGGGG